MSSIIVRLNKNSATNFIIQKYGDVHLKYIYINKFYTKPKKIINNYNNKSNLKSFFYIHLCQKLNSSLV